MLLVYVAAETGGIVLSVGEVLRKILGGRCGSIPHPGRGSSAYPSTLDALSPSILPGTKPQPHLLLMSLNVAKCNKIKTMQAAVFSMVVHLTDALSPSILPGTNPELHLKCMQKNFKLAANHEKGP